MERKNLIYGIIGLLAVILGFIAKGFYRPYILDNNIDDFGFAAASPSFFYVIGFSQLLLIKQTKYPWMVITIIILGSFAYEVMQSLSKKSIDINDIIASLAAGVISIFVWKIIDKNYADNK